MTQEPTSKKADQSGQDIRNEHPQNPFSDRQLRQIFEGGNAADIVEEMQRLFLVIIPEGDDQLFVNLHHEISRVFAGKAQEFRESQFKYHDLRHTHNVAFATLRLFHGLHCEGIHLAQDTVVLGLISAYFHDTGMLLTKGDSESSGATYLKSHEMRSIAFARQYLNDHDFPISYAQNCEAVINCTNLTIEPDAVRFATAEAELAGHVLGTADILAQMADRYYLECLPLLYREQQDAGIQQHPSALALMRQTTTFFHEVIEKRLHQGFNNRYTTMRTHFREWCKLDRNLYMEFIDKNIKYLENVIQWHDSGVGDLKMYLRRQQPKF